MISTSIHREFSRKVEKIANNDGDDLPKRNIAKTNTTHTLTHTHLFLRAQIYI